ncbi:MAG: sigma-54 dependent transcriptional regulator [Gemmatimonadota bacterium]
MATILIVDDEAPIRDILRQIFEYEGHEVETASSGREGLERMRTAPPDVIFLDVKMPGMDGLQVLERIRNQDPEAVVVMISGHGTVDAAVHATRAGAYDFLEKPLDSDRLLVTVRNALEVRGLSRSVRELRDENRERYRIVGQSEAIRVLLDRVDRVAPTDSRVLITGENGTGKELVARALHAGSSRARGPFVEVNCAAIPSELIESELFGHVKGSFTGAVGDRAGRFEQADGGTLFLDEVGDMSLPAQAKVLRALEEGVVTRVGGQKLIRVSVRVVAATNKNLEEEIRAGGFREDLFYRLNVVPIHVPPLRERRGDIPELVQHFLERIRQADQLPARKLHPEAMKRLTHLNWPGNVRELRNTVERLVILASGDEIGPQDVDALAGAPAGDPGLGVRFLSADSYAEFRDQAERAFLLHKLRAHDWNVSETARVLDMPRSNLYKKIERHGLSREE